VAIGRLSFGTRQKVALIAALVADADLFLLDEPFNGLDALATHELQACLNERRDAGRSVLVALHGIDRVARHFDLAFRMADGTVDVPMDLRAMRTSGVASESIEAELLDALRVRT
jgi:ABC-type multidrug transport system ATPase subunit